MKKTDTMKIAFSGITCGLCIVVLMMGNIVPFATYACPAMARFFIFPVVFEYGEKTAFTLYIAASALSFMLVPDYELVLMFVLVFGLYTVFKLWIDRRNSKAMRMLIKFIYVNVTVALTYLLLLVIFPVQALLAEFAEYTMPFMILLVVMFNLTFFVYDMAIQRVLVVYIHKLRPRLFGKNKKKNG